MLVSFGAEKCKKVRLVNRGPNWDNGDNYINIKRIELVSNDAKYNGGVLSTLVSLSENNDPHKCPVKVTSSFYDFTTFCSIDSLSTISTCNDKNSWFQIEFTQGLTVIDGFRLKRFETNKMRNYKIICTDDVNKDEDEWTTLIEVEENGKDEHKILDIYEFSKQSPPCKYIRLLQTGPNWDDALNLVFIHFDLFGKYLA